MDPRQYPPPSPMYAQQSSQNGSREKIASPAPLRAATAAMNRAELFEDEKRRIMSSCFSKKDETGQLMQSYITHIRVEEDGQYPSAPPPPDAPAHHKKNRVIAIAVKSTGRVWMHKARENEDLTFQIGKSWPLEELQAIQSFSLATAQTPEEQARSKWAGSVGFVITMSKPYYWAAKSTKEKEFFIGSLVKIYGKYTSGNVPQLYGFEPNEKDAILRGVQQSANRNMNAASQPARVAGGPAVPPSSPNRTDTLQPGQRRQPSYEQRPVTPASRGPPTPNFENGANQVAQVGELGVPRFPTPDRHGNARVQSPASFASSPNVSTPPAISQSNRYDAPQAPSPLPSARSLAESTGNSSALASTENLGSTLGSSTASNQLRPNGQPRTGRYGNSSDSLPMDKDVRRRPVTPETSSVNGAPQMPPERRRPPLRGNSVNESQQSSTTDLQSTTFTERAVVDQRTAGSSIDKSVAPGSNEQQESTDSTARTSEERSFRPGLGPMIGQKSAPDLASKLRKAATAYNAFKPRAGGAGERLLQKPDGSAGPTDVVPAPSTVRSMTGDSTKSQITDTSVLQKPPAPQIQSDAQAQDTQTTPQTADQSATREIPAQAEPPQPEQPISSVQKPPTKSVNRILHKRRSNLFQKSLQALGIDPWIIEGKEQEYEEVLRDFGWERDTLSLKKLEEMEVQLKREIGRLEAGGSVGYAEQKDERVEAVEMLLDKAIAECEETEGLLTLYGVELGTLHDDIAYIEAQSQGLQVQTANQKLLQSELQSLVKTISIDRDQLEPLRSANLDELSGLTAIEDALFMLYKALSTIDPLLVQSQRTMDQDSEFTSSSLTKMKALREKKEMYLKQSSGFLDKLRLDMDQKFNKALYASAAATSQKPLSRKMSGGNEPDRHDDGRRAIWPYSPLMLYAKEVDTGIWGEILRSYVQRARPMYQNEIANSILSWKKKARKPTGDEQEALFTNQEKEVEGLSSTARKLTVKRSATLARGLRSANLDKRSPADKSLEGSLYPSEIFSFALDEMVPLISTEQHFFVDFFHANSLESMDFLDAVTTARRDRRQVSDWAAPKPIEPNRHMAKKVSDSIEEIFGSWPSEMQSLADWATSADPFQGIGVLVALERKRNFLADSSQEFVVSGLGKVHEKLCTIFTRFVDEQVRAIEDTKVRIKKRKGVIAFMKVFPHFAALVESMLPPPDDAEKLETRTMVDDAYNRINRAMFDSLKVIAKESPAAASSSGGYGLGVNSHSADSEDKEALNYHILLIENAFHFINEVDERGDGVLRKWMDKAMYEMDEHQGSYVKAVIRRPLGKLLDFVESVETLQSTSPGRDAPTSIPTQRPSHSRSAFKKVLGSYDAKEVRRGVDTLKKRVEKHFGEADDPNISHKLVIKVLEECEKHYTELLERLERIVKDVYEGSVEIEFGKADIQQAFRR